MTEADPKVQVSVERALTGILALMAASRDDANEGASTDRRPTEVILDDIGFTLSEISLVTGRKYETVRTTIRRQREKASKPKG